MTHVSQERPPDRQAADGDRRRQVLVVDDSADLDRSPEAQDELARSRDLLDQAQHLAQVGSWELDLRTGAITGSAEYFRLLSADPDEFHAGGLEIALRSVHPDDVQRTREALEAAAQGSPIDFDLRVLPRGRDARQVHALGTLHRDAPGDPGFIRGSIQDVTDQRAAEQTLAGAVAAREVAAREHGIADELQRSLLPERTFEPEHLDVATYYQAGVEGTQVGGDWHDVIELGAGRTALVMGDVMGRGVRAAAVMGQLRSAVRAYARLDLPPADLLEFLDGVVRELGEDQIVTCLYATYDPADRCLTWANAGHLPPLLADHGEPGRPLTDATGAPLGSGPMTLTEAQVELPAGALVALYTDGLVERRDRDIDNGIAELAGELTRLPALVEKAPATLVDALLPDGPEDDVAVLLARVPPAAGAPMSVLHRVRSVESAVADARELAGATLREWQIDGKLAGDAVLAVSELVTNAIRHGRAPIELRLRCTSDQLYLEMYDAATYLPRRLRPTPDDEFGRGLELVAAMADRWGTRPTANGKSVWCVFSLA
jgi:anti-sigma regulatory factor (Ser/Thr protein kinase)